jgi:ATP-dependent DNA helicase PIF1
MVLKDSDDIVSSMDKDIRDYGLLELDDQDVEQWYHNREVREQYSLGVNKIELRGVHNLNPEQVSGYTEIFEHGINRKGRVFFVDGPIDTGKTFLYRCLIATVRSESLIAVATATFGIETLKDQRRRPEGGLNGSQSKFLNGTWSISRK